MVCTAMLAASSAAHATLKISGAPTSNVNCQSGVCTATARSANLNAGDLAAMLASSDVTVASGHKGRDIAVTGAASWSGAHRLTLDSYASIFVRQALVDQGSGAVTVTTGDGSGSGGIVFTGKGRIAFWDAADSLTINSTSYTLVSSLADLASHIQADPNGIYALADDYDASADGVYRSAPITVPEPNVFQGELEGLGNSILHLKIHGNQDHQELGLFAENFGEIRNLRLVKVDVKGRSASQIGAISGSTCGHVLFTSVSGRVSGTSGSQIGGFCGAGSGGDVDFSNFSGEVSGSDDGGAGPGQAGGIYGSMDTGELQFTFSTASVRGGVGWHAGGIAGDATGFIDRSYSTGAVVVGDNGQAGGLIGSFAGSNAFAVTDSYATGVVQGGVGSTVGGFIGMSQGMVMACYSTGAVASGSGNAVGGFIGNDIGANDLSVTYFDTTTSGQSHGVGNNTGYPGITGLTTEQFLAGLPGGFQPQIWAEAPTVNGGFPYLIPPPLE